MVSKKLASMCLKFIQFSRVDRLLSLMALVSFVSACNYKTPATETPAPADEGIAKSFFYVEQKSDKKDAKSGETVNVPKTFVCGWVSEMETGSDVTREEGPYTNNVIVPNHCNLVFEITQTRLIARQVNPSFPDDPSRWEIAMTFPITSHYYLEKEKDAQGRETNKIIKNSSRSHWSARTHMDLDLEKVSFGNLWEVSRWFKTENSHVDQIEWDNKAGFFAFRLLSMVNGSNHVRLRFNFKTFEHDTSFVKTPFNDINYRKMNVLHIVGEKINGVHQILHAAHWDLRKKHEIRLWKVPENRVSLIKEIVQDWNRVFKEIGASTEDSFVVSDTPAERSFDLRYSTLAWVDDEKVSTYSPLGVGMALADVKNGEILSGMITIYAGMVEKYVKNFSIDYLSEDGSSHGKGALSSGKFNFLSKIPARLALPKVMTQINFSPIRSFSVAKSKSTSGSNRKSGDKKVEDLQIEELDLIQNQIAASLPGVINNHFELAGSSMTEDFYSRMVKNNILKDGGNSDSKATEDRPASEKSASQKNVDRSAFHSQPAQCMERNFRDIGAGWFAAKQQMPATGDRDEKVLRRVLKELITHEYGHFLGLGHQFKENILPGQDTVPAFIYKDLLSRAKTKNMTNYSSVMGYRHPIAEISESTAMLPGPHDRLVLRYLYRQEYSTYKAGAADFTYHQIPDTGIIPESASYFPQCNDIDAIFSMDPFCNRFDRGYSAVTIVKNYIDNINSDRLQALFAFSDTRERSSEEYEARLWSKAFSSFGRMRLFYDYMRVQYKKEIDKLRGSEEDLYKFSQECSGGKTGNKNLENLFASNPSLKELCAASKLVLEHFKEIVSGNVTDYTKHDINDRFTPGGMSGGDATRDWSKVTGSWNELTGLPFKLAALYTLSVGVPYAYSDYFGLIGVPLYDNPLYKFNYALMFPKEYLDIMTSNLKNNLRFAALNEASGVTEMGASVSSLAWFQHLFNESHNDFKLFPENYSKRIRKSGQFDLSMVAVIMKGIRKEGSPNYMESFETKVLDLNTKKEFPAAGYFLPGGQIIVSAPGMIVYPITSFMPFSNEEGYVIAYKLDYVLDDSDRLGPYGPKAELKSLNDRLVSACFDGTNGKNNGLRYYFSSTEKNFPGYKMVDGIAFSDAKKSEFVKSLQEVFDSYYAFSGFTEKPVPETCQEALRGMGLIISSAAIMSGYWLPEASSYIQK